MTVGVQRDASAGLWTPEEIRERWGEIVR
jgi:hypothetical protein